LGNKKIPVFCLSGKKRKKRGEEKKLKWGKKKKKKPPPPPPWSFDPIPGHDLFVQGFAMTLNGDTTLRRNPLDE